MYTAGQLHRMTYLSTMFITYMYIICSDTVIQRLYVPEIKKEKTYSACLKACPETQVINLTSTHCFMKSVLNNSHSFNMFI